MPTSAEMTAATSALNQASDILTALVPAYNNLSKEVAQFKNANPDSDTAAMDAAVARFLPLAQQASPLVSVLNTAATTTAAIPADGNAATYATVPEPQAASVATASAMPTTTTPASAQTPPAQNQTPAPAPAPTAASITLDPAAATVAPGQAQQFGASVDDATGAPLATQPTVSYSAAEGTIDASGLYTAPATAPESGTDTVTATVGDVTETATITIPTPAPSGS